MEDNIIIQGESEKAPFIHYFANHDFVICLSEKLLAARR